MKRIATLTLWALFLAALSGFSHSSHIASNRQVAGTYKPPLKAFLYLPRRRIT